MFYALISITIFLGGKSYIRTLDTFLSRIPFQPSGSPRVEKLSEKMASAIFIALLDEVGLKMMEYSDKICFSSFFCRVDEQLFSSSTPLVHHHAHVHPHSYDSYLWNDIKSLFAEFLLPSFGTFHHGHF